MDLSYNEILLKLLNNDKDNQLFTDKLLVNVYLTLLSLNNNNYNEKIYNQEIDIIEDFLRKINNLKGCRKCLKKLNMNLIMIINI